VVNECFFVLYEYFSILFRNNNPTFESILLYICICLYSYIYICVCVRVCAIFILNCRDDHVAITVKQKKSIMPGVCLLK